MITEGSMILNGIEMPLRFDDQNDAETQRAKRIHEIVSETITELDNSETNLSCDPEVSIYDPDPRSDYDRNYYSVMVYGGLNGTGFWSNYFKSLFDLILKLETKFEDIWIIEFMTDCTDDAFGVRIGIYPFINQLEGSSEEEQ